ncbi:PPPDE putative peptidase domain-containing protein [Paraphysoderma sedebokerense]|nr:PPPDE putative peptidase domain-containing protein [Paraphysoderma sedebokerense]
MSDVYISNSSSSLFISSSSSENVSPISVNRSNPRSSSARSSQDSLPHRIPVYVNVYDMASANSYLYWFGLGIYHSGLYLPTFNAEFCFGGHDIDGLTGVFQVPPKTGVPGLIFRKSVFVGNATVSETEVHQILRAMSLEYTGKSYNLLTRNCNHFTTDLAQRLCSKSPPKW